jgi:hypothetical protein
MDNTTGNRYFDFEMYQTDIYYDRASGRWFGYGPNEGHTSWQFNAAGNVTAPGDIIFSGEFQSSTLTNVQARIWVSRATWMTVTPTAFNWSGLFDGATAGSAYGYASIMPKTAGAYYTGLGSANNTWAGPFQVVLQDNSLTTNYIKDQFIEMSVNLSKLGLDPVGLIGGDICGTPFNRIVVKTRASASFTAELKDFVAPTDLFLAPRVQAVADIPIFCDSSSISDICVTNPWASSVYSWSTPNGNILGSTTGTCIRVDAPGDYIVTQRLSAGCNPYAYDTVTIVLGDTLVCSVLSDFLLSFRGIFRNEKVELIWSVTQNNNIDHFEIEKSFDGDAFLRIGSVTKIPDALVYISFDELNHLLAGSFIYYRLKIVGSNGIAVYSKIIAISTGQQVPVRITPNPVRDRMQIFLNGDANDEATVIIYGPSGKLIYHKKERLQKGLNTLTVYKVPDWSHGLYIVTVMLDDKVYSKKVLIAK